jgi:hypothetical protein
VWKLGCNLQENNVVLEKLHIYKRPSYECKGLQYKGEVRYEGQHGAVELHLNHETSLRIMAVVADSLVASSKEIANDLTRNIIDVNAGLLAAPVDSTPVEA